MILSFNGADFALKVSENAFIWADPFKGGFYLNLSGILGSLKRVKRDKKVMEHHQS